MLRNDHLYYKWLIMFGDTSADNKAYAIIDQCAVFGVPNGPMSDGLSQVRNETVRLICKDLRVPHHFTIPYTPWSNGSGERMRKKLRRVSRPIVYQLRLEFSYWISLFPIAQSVLNLTAPDSGHQDVCLTKRSKPIHVQRHTVRTICQYCGYSRAHRGIGLCRRRSSSMEPGQVEEYCIVRRYTEWFWAKFRFGRRKRLPTWAEVGIALVKLMSHLKNVFILPFPDERPQKWSTGKWAQNPHEVLTRRTTAQVHNCLRCIRWRWDACIPFDLTDRR